MKRTFASQSGGWIFAVLLVAVTLPAYRPAWYGGFIWDDDVYVVNNELLTAPNGLSRIWFSLDSPSQYFPLVYTTFRLERAFWGLNPLGYHLVNILLHAGNALLLWRLLARLKIPGAVLAAAIFALHPVHAESVAWITERKNVLMGFFFLLTLLAWVAFLNPNARRPWRFYTLALGLYVLALFSKATACTLPAALLLVLWLQKRPLTRQRLIQVIPFVVLGFAMGLVTIWWERYHQGTQGTLFALGPIERLLIASHAIWFYLGKLLWPSNLTFIYPRWPINPSRLASYGWLIATVGLCAAIYYARRYVGRGLEVAALFFVTALSPVLGFIMLYTFRYTFVADHYQYLASIGPISLVSAGIMSLARTFREIRSLLFTLASSILVAMAVLTWRQSSLYADVEALWRATIARNPYCWMAYNNLGVVRMQKGDVDQAITYFDRTLAIQADYAEADYNLGNALLQKGETEQAIAHCQRAVAAQPNDPEAQVSLGNALLRKGETDRAVACYKKALAIRPYYFAANYNLGSALLQKGDIDSAIYYCRAAILIQPENTDGYINLAIALEEKGQVGEAIGCYEKALTISPQSVLANNNLAWLLVSCADPSWRNGGKALQLATRAQQSSHDANAVVLHTLAAAYAEVGQFSKAIEIARQASRLAAAEGDGTLAATLDQEISTYELGLAPPQTAK